MRVKLMLLSLLVGLSSACDITGPEEKESWFVSVEFSLGDSIPEGLMVGFVSFPNSSSRLKWLEDGASTVVPGEPLWVGFGVPLRVPRATSISYEGIHKWEDSHNVLFPLEDYAARVVVEDTSGNQFDTAHEVNGAAGRLSYMLLPLSRVESGWIGGLMNVSCIQEGSAALHLSYLGVREEKGTEHLVRDFFDPADLTITCSRERPEPL